MLRVIQNFLFRRTSVASLVNDDLYQAKRDLLQAEASREYWEHNEKMLKARVARLEKKHSAELKASNVVEFSTKQKAA